MRVTTADARWRLFCLEFAAIGSGALYAEDPGKERGIPKSRLSVSATFEHSATPPDFEEGFEERQFQYASLGLDAASLAAKLRKHAGLPARTGGTWDPVAYMVEQKATIKRGRQQVASRHSLPSA